MSCDTQSNFGLDYKILLQILSSIEKRTCDVSTSTDIVRCLIMAGTSFVISFVFSLRGNEGFMLNCGGLIKHPMYVGVPNILFNEMCLRMSIMYQKSGSIVVRT